MTGSGSWGEITPTPSSSLLIACLSARRRAGTKANANLGRSSHGKISEDGRWQVNVKVVGAGLRLVSRLITEIFHSEGEFVCVFRRRTLFLIAPVFRPEVCAFLPTLKGLLVQCWLSLCLPITCLSIPTSGALYFDIHGWRGGYQRADHVCVCV